MAFNSNELNVIRSYVAVNGELPDQSVLNSAFESTSLNEAISAIGNIPGRSDVSNAGFVETLYTNAGLEMDGEGQDYWVSLLRDFNMPRAELVGHFQFAASNNGGFETTAADAEAAGLAGSESEFEEVSGPGDDDDQQTPEDLYTDVVFDTGEVQFSQEGAPGHNVFNLGWDALNEGAGLLSKDYTFTLKDQINGGNLDAAGKVDFDPVVSDFNAYFLSPLLEPTASFSGSRMEVRIADRLAPANDKDATLENVQVNDFTIALNGTTYTVAANEENGLADARTYAELEAAVQAAVEELKAENPALEEAGLSVSLGGEFTTNQYDEEDNLTGDQVLGDKLVFEVDRGTLNSDLFSASLTSGSGGGSDGFARAFDQEGDTVTGVIQTDLDLDNVGYGSQGGNINIGGQSNSDKGIEVFNVDAANGVWLTSLTSSPLRSDFNALEVINLNGSGYFKVGEQSGDGIVNNGANAGLVDIRTFNGSDFNGDILLDAMVSEKVISRDLDAADTDSNGAQDNVDYVYNTASGDDTLYVNFAQEVIAREDAALSINSGLGDDVIETAFVNGDDSLATNWYLDQKDLKNATIEAGAGNDTVKTTGAGDFTILAGSGNDTVYTDNSGEAATWVFNAQNTLTSDLRGDVLTQHLLYNAQLTVTISGANVGGGVLEDTFGGTADNAAVAAANGFEKTVTIPTTDLYGTERSINQAIKDAINNDDVLNKLLEAVDGPDNTLLVNGKIDGLFDADDLAVDIAAADIADFSSSEKDALVSALQAAAGDSTLTYTDTDLQNALNSGVTSAQGSGVGYNGTSVFGTEVTGTALTNEVQTLTITADDVDDDDEGLSVTYGTDGAGGTSSVNVTLGTGVDVTDATAVAAEVASVLNLDGGFSSLATAGASGGVVTITYSGTTDINTQVSATASGTTNGLAAAGGTTTNGGNTVNVESDIDGSQSTVESNNVINMGSGQDVVVLGTGDQSNDTLVWTGYNNGENTVVNFMDDNNEASVDYVDFNAYLDGMTNASGSSESATDIAQAVVANDTFNANGVSVLTAFDFTTETNEDWDALNATNLLSALQSTTDTYAGANQSNFTLENAVTDLVGSVRDHVVLVENNLNSGEYKMFHVTSTEQSDGTETYTDAELIGQVDFGDTVNAFTTDNLA